MKNDSLEPILPFINYGNVDLQVQAVLEALQKNKKRLAADRALAASQFFPSFPECHALCGEVLSQAREPLAALAAWDEALRRAPWQAVWFTKAFFLAWSYASISEHSEIVTTYVHDWIILLQRTFISAPQPELLEELERKQLLLAGTGSLGIHQGKILGWIWVPSGTTITLAVSNGGPSLPLPKSQLLQREKRDLIIFSLEIPLHDRLFFVTVQSSCTSTQGIIAGNPVPCDPYVCSPLQTQHDKRLRTSIVVIIPVYDDRAATLGCLASIFVSQKKIRTYFDILVVWDHGPDKKLYADLQKLSLRKKIVFIETPLNMGFLSCINYGLRHCSKQQDVILLNSDTIVWGDWIDRLKSAASLPKTATVTPLGSEAELVSFPSYYHRAEVTTLRDTCRIDEACRKAASWKKATLTIPVGVGFCMYITHTARAILKGLDGYQLFSGYGEEVDFCLRAREEGFKNLVAYNVFVAHLGGRSFGLAKRALATQNNKVLFNQYPYYKAEYDAFLCKNPIRAYYEKIARELYRPLHGPLKVYSTLDTNFPEVVQSLTLYRDDGRDWASLFVQPFGHEIQVTLKVDQGFILPDQFFYLPTDYKKLLAVLEILHPEFLEIYQTGMYVTIISEMLPYPKKIKKLYPSKNKDISPYNKILLYIHHTSLLVTPPYTVADWKILRNIAHIYPQCIFWVLDLDTFLGAAPRPGNVRSISKAYDLLALGVKELLILDEDPIGQESWKIWAKKHDLNSLYHDPEI